MPPHTILPMSPSPSPSFPSPASLLSFPPPPPRLVLSLPFPSPHSFLLLPDPLLCVIASVCLRSFSRCPGSISVASPAPAADPSLHPHPPRAPSRSSSPWAGPGLSSTGPDLCTVLALSWGFPAKQSQGHKCPFRPSPARLAPAPHCSVGSLCPAPPK